MFGLAPEWLLYDGRPVATSLVLSHDEQLTRLAAYTPEAVDTAVVAGDPTFDRMLRSRHLCNHYRRALGVAHGQKLVTISTTWWRHSLLGTWPSLFRELLACLPTDEYKVAAVIHPNIWHGHGPWQVHTWLADCVRAGLLLAPPEESWQAMLIAADIVVGDHGATTCYAAGLGRPVLLASFPDDDVATGSAAELLGRTASRLNRHASLHAQIEETIHQPTDAYQGIHEALTSCPGESAARLRALFYQHLDLPEPAGAALVPVIQPNALAIPPGEGPTAQHVVLVPGQTDTEPATMTRYPADVTTDSSATTQLDVAFLVAHQDHASRVLLDQAAVILVTPAEHTNQTHTALDEALTQHPGATLAATATVGVCLAHARNGDHATLRAQDPTVAASVVHQWLHTDQPLADLPLKTNVVAGPMRYTVEVVSAVTEPVV